MLPSFDNYAPDLACSAKVFVVRRFWILIVVALIAASIYSATGGDGGILTPDASARDEIREILRTEALVVNHPTPVGSSTPPQQVSNDTPGLDQAIQKVIGELDSQGYAIITDAAQASPPPFDSQEVEKQIDTLPLAPFEETIARSFDSSAEGQMLRRIVLSRRYPQQVPNGPRLEDRYIQEMAGRPSAAIQSIASALRSLPKEEFREEHVVLRDLVNRLPEGYERLQEALPDEEFK